MMESVDDPGHDRASLNSMWFGDMWVLYVGEASPSTRHEQEAAQLVLPLTGAVQARIGAARLAHYDCAFIPSATPHEFTVVPDVVASLWFECEVDAAMARGQLASALDNGRLEEFRSRLRSILAGDRAGATVAGLVDGLEASIGAQSRREIDDPRIAEALATIHDRGPGQVSLAALADSFGMTRSSFGALFARSLGCPFGRYMRWMQMEIAGNSLSDAQGLELASRRAGLDGPEELERLWDELLGFFPLAPVRL